MIQNVTNGKSCDTHIFSDFIDIKKVSTSSLKEEHIYTF